MGSSALKQPHKSPEAQASTSGGGGQGGCTLAECWRGAEFCAVLLHTKSNSCCGWEGRFEGKELPPGCGSPCSQTHARVSAEQGDVPQLKSKSILGCPFELPGLLHSALPLPNCPPALPSVSCSTSDLQDSGFPARPESTSEADAVSRHRALPPCVRPC